MRSLLVAALLSSTCASNPERSEDGGPSTPDPENRRDLGEDAPSPADGDDDGSGSEDQESTKADVLSVSVTGDPQSYTFAVELRSPDTGCERYANWWEVVSEDGALLYRRILGHSHVDEQPFTRSGGPVPVDADQVVWVRGHMDPDGYGGQAMRGSVAEGFTVADAGALPTLEDVDPQPESCAF